MPCIDIAVNHQLCTKLTTERSHWDVTHRRLEVSCRRFGTTYLTLFQGWYGNVSNQQIVYAAQNPKDAKISFIPRRKLEVRPQKFKKMYRKVLRL
jgi:hypothetical protein